MNELQRLKVRHSQELSAAEEAHARVQEECEEIRANMQCMDRKHKRDMTNLTREFKAFQMMTYQEMHKAGDRPIAEYKASNEA